jgi:hypothetical protein
LHSFCHPSAASGAREAFCARPVFRGRRRGLREMLALVTGAIVRGVQRPAGEAGWIGQPTERVSQTEAAIYRDGAALRRQPATAPAHDVRVNTTLQVEIGQSLRGKIGVAAEGCRGDSPYRERGGQRDPFGLLQCLKHSQRFGCHVIASWECPASTIAPRRWASRGSKRKLPLRLVENRR